MLPFLATMFFQTLVLLGVFVYLYREQRSPHLRWWTVAWLVSVLRHGLAFVAAVWGIDRLSVIELLLALPQAGGVLAGTLTLSHRRPPRYLAVVFGLGAAWVVGGWLLDLSFVAWTLPTLGFLGASTIGAGVVLMRTLPASIGRWIASGALVVWGLHQLDYPFLRPIPEVAPWGYALAGVLETLTAIGFLVLSNERVITRERRLARQHQDFIENLPVGVYETTVDGRFRMANRTLQHSLGYTLDELRRLDIARDLYVDPDERRRLMERAPGEILPPTEVTWKRADGSPIRIVLHGRRIRDAEGRFSLFEGVAQDVTDQRRMEEIAARSSRMEALGRLAGGVAHDFNNLLMVIQAGIDMLRAHVPSTEMRWLDDMDAAAERAATFTTTLLSVARGGRGERRLIDVARALSDARPMLERLAGEGILDVCVDTHNPHIRGEPGAFDQIVLNLVTNARDAGATSVHIECVDVELGHREAMALALGPGSYLRLRVRDNGSGMDAATCQRIFEPFFTTRDEGTGLGLATVYAAVDATGGRIDVESQPGRGTTFSIYWPRLAPAVTVSGVTQARPLGGGEVLVLDDEQAVREAVAAMLSRLGFDVRTAHDRDSAFQIARASPTLQVVLSDVNLRGDDTGPEVAQALQEVLPSALFLFMSGYPPTGLDDETMARLLIKPFTQVELESWLAQRGVTPRSSAEPEMRD